MNKVITINLGGTAWQLEEGGYDTLRDYLQTAAARLQGNPDREEIISDIECSIAEKFRGLVNNHKTVVLNKEVAAVLAQMGPIEGDPGKTADSGPNPAGATGGPGATGAPGTAREEQPPGAAAAPRRLYRIHEGAMIAGVCNGIAAYVSIDPTLVRLGFVFLTLFWGSGVVAYIIMAIVVPEASTPEEKAAASGRPTTAEDFIRRAKEGYYEALKGFPDRQARREWKRRFKREMHAHAGQWRRNWCGYWAEPGPVPPVPPVPPMPFGVGVTLPILSLLHAVVKILWLCALVSLLASGTLFGMSLPFDLPVWAELLLLFLIYGVIEGPLKIARRACYWGYGRPPAARPFVLLLDALIWFAVAATLLWLAWHHFPELSQAVKSLPALMHQAADDIQKWWQAK
jgi:phage shock protein PspC (stress-responsive transcriptional regulator)